MLQIKLFGTFSIKKRSPYTPSAKGFFRGKFKTGFLIQKLPRLSSDTKVVNFIFHANYFLHTSIFFYQHQISQHARALVPAVVSRYS